MDLYGTEYGLCMQTASFWQLIGYGLMIFKIVIPVILIVIGIIVLGKAVISDDEKDMKKGINSLIKKFILSVVIFFLPNIISSLFGIVSEFDEIKNDFAVCKHCISHPKSERCEGYVELSKDAN